MLRPNLPYPTFMIRRVHPENQREVLEQQALQEPRAEQEAQVERVVQAARPEPVQVQPMMFHSTCSPVPFPVATPTQCLHCSTACPCQDRRFEQPRGLVQEPPERAQEEPEAPRELVLEELPQLAERLEQEEEMWLEKIHQPVQVR